MSWFKNYKYMSVNTRICQFWRNLTEKMQAGSKNWTTPNILFNKQKVDMEAKQTLEETTGHGVLRVSCSTHFCKEHCEALRTDEEQLS